MAHTLDLKFQISDGLLAVGSFQPSNIKTEFYDFGTSEWTVLDDYPFSSGVGVDSFAMVFISKLSAYIIIGGYGGYDGYDNSAISMFRNGVWSNAGQLNMARSVNFCLF